jgi:LacI family transcriptional regulator
MARDRTTIRDIAELTGHAVSTVSRALRGDPKITVATRERITKAAEKLGYRPNIFARGLSTQDSRMLALLTPPLRDSLYYAYCLHVFEKHARRLGYFVLLCSVDEEGYRLDDYLDLVRGGMFSGVFFLDYNFADARTFAIMKEVEDSGVPHVIVYDDPPLPETGYNIVRVDFEEQARLAVRHLLELGHTHIAMVSPRTRKQFIHGYLRAYQEMNVPVGQPELYTIGQKAWQTRDLNSIADEVVNSYKELDPRPTAVFVGRSVLVIPLLRALKRGGFDLPEDMAIVTTKDINSYSYLEPALTSVSSDLDEMAESAITLMAESLEASEAHEPHTVTSDLKVIVRESCGAKLVGSAEV